jgi:hypothetical protein
MCLFKYFLYNKKNQFSDSGCEFIFGLYSGPQVQDLGEGRQENPVLRAVLDSNRVSEAAEQVKLNYDCVAADLFITFMTIDIHVTMM